VDGFMNDHPESMMGRIARKQIDLMGKVKVERNKIFADTTMDSDTKRARLDDLDRKTVNIARMAYDFMNPRVLDNLKMPKREGSVSREEYYKRMSEAVGDAWDDYRHQYQQMSDLSPSDRANRISGIIQQAYTNYREIQRNPMTDLLKPYKADTILNMDKPTRQERLAAHDAFGYKVPKGIMPAFTGGRHKGEDMGGE
jgi:hypothetical protein